MDFVLFILFSSMEYLAMFALMFALFRFEYKFYHNSVLFICAVLSFVSYSLRIGFDQALLDPIMNVLLIFAFLYYIFQIQIFYSSVMTVTGYLAYGITQAIMFFGLDFLGLISIETAKPNTIQGYILQIFTSAAAFLVTYLIKRKNYGFAYVPHGQRAFVLYKGLNKIFLFSIIIASVVAWITLYYSNAGNLHIYLLMMIPLISMFVVIIYLSIKKEYSND